MDYDSESAMSQAFLANLASGVLLHAPYQLSQTQGVRLMADESGEAKPLHPLSFILLTQLL